MSKTKKSSSSLSSKVKKFSRAGLAVLSSIPTPGWGSASKKALAVSVSRSKVKKTSTKNKNQTNKKTSKKLSSLKKMLELLKQKSRYGRMYTNARKLSSEWKLKDRVLKLKTMMFPTAVFVPKRPTNEDEMLAAAYKDIYKQLRKNGELPDLTGGYEIDPQTGDYYSDFYSQRKVLGNPSSNLKPYTGGYLLTHVLDELTEDYQPLFDDQAPFGKQLEAQIYLVVRPAQAIGRAVKSVSGKVKTYEQARNEALSWLEQRGFKSEKQTFGKFGYTKNEPIGRQTNDGKVGFRIEHDSRSGAHINVWAGKEKGPHFEFDASEKTVKKIQRRFR